MSIFEVLSPLYPFGLAKHVAPHGSIVCMARGPQPMVALAEPEGMHSRADYGE